MVFNDPGLQAYSSKTLAFNRNEIPSIFSKLSGLKILLSFAFVALSSLTAYAIGYDSRQIYLLFLIGIGMVLSSSFVLMRTVLTGMGNYRMDSWLSSLDRVLIILVLGTILFLPLFSNQITIESFALTQTLCYLIACFIMVSVLGFKKLIILPTIKWGEVSIVLKATLPFAGIIFLTSICNRIDVVMLNEILPKKQAHFESGIYAAGYRFLDAANMVGFLFGALLLPMYARLMSTKEDVSSLFKTSFGILLTVGCVLGIGSIFYATEIFKLSYTDIYLQHADIMLPLMMSLIPITLSNAFGPIILASGKLKAFNLTLLAAIVLNVVLNLLVIPQYGALGSAYTTFITEIFLLIAMYFISSTIPGISFGLVKIIKYTGYIAICIGTGFILKSIDLYWMIELAIFVMTSVALSLMLRLAGKNLLSILKSN